MDISGYRPKRVNTSMHGGQVLYSTRVPSTKSFKIYTDEEVKALSGECITIKEENNEQPSKVII